MKMKRWLAVVIALFAMINLLACTIDIESGGDWSDVNREWMTLTVAAAEHYGGSRP